MSNQPTPTLDLPPPPQVAGISLAGTKPYTISADENRALCESIGVAPTADGTAHPIYFYIATQVGMGMTVAGLCSVCEFDVEEGPMMASSKVTFSRPLVTGQPYQITGRIVSLVRKPSRKLGVMDMLEYSLELSLPDGTPMLATTNVWVLPRRRLA
ncbi:MAG TPA: hypothetical protein VGL34_29535 [Steroidobacteraceae bacterium]|jgi:hypothetical protein